MSLAEPFSINIYSFYILFPHPLTSVDQAKNSSHENIVFLDKIGIRIKRKTNIPEDMSHFFENGVFKLR